VSAIEELLERRSGGSGLETEITAVGIRYADYATSLSPQKLELTSLDRYSSLSDSDHGVCLFVMGVKLRLLHTGKNKFESISENAMGNIWTYAEGSDVRPNNSKR
jgi:hypothetical protein